jgi:hypothetical protein
MVWGQDVDHEEDNRVPGGFYLPNSNRDYIGVFPITRLSGYHVYRAGEPAQSVGGISGSPFIFHSGPSYCGWIGIPGLGWFGCGLDPNLSLAPMSHSSAGGTTSIQLAEGMSRETVLEAVGAPDKKILLGLKEIWEYKGYSLLFESGGLKEIR